ncbi:N-acetyltransferase [Methanorbis rubei]|uniref:Peptidyl-lysine N-acetyltransferase YiaC n=1 Tax=Methanorbis rubei TaxID=3028300 RepID=A0AAE4SB40_9EURY|nr:Peptidyl-lysine N-acetyltransferase YiaC [Methanocorpusculaceae archaeon Cs1]
MIRQFRSSDTDVVMKIWLDASIVAHDFISPSYWQEQFSVVRDQYLPISETYVFVEDDLIRGFVSILDRNIIGALFVAPNFQRQSIGSALIRYVQEIAKDLTLCVYVENSAAKIFYEKFGFVIMLRRSTETGHDEYMMRFGE